MSETPRRTDAVPPRLRARQSAAATSPMILRASSTSEAPAAVGRTPVWVRSNATTPNSRSKVVTCFTRAGVEMLSRSAAFEKLPSSAAATIASRRLSYISPSCLVLTSGSYHTKTSVILRRLALH